MENVKDFCLFVYEIDGRDNYFVMSKNNDGVYVSFTHIGDNCIFDEVSKMLKVAVGSYSFSASYNDIVEAIRNFIRNNSYVFDIPRNTISLYLLYSQLQQAVKFLERMKSPEEKIRIKALKEREARDARIREARIQTIDVADLYSVSMKRVYEAYLESLF